MALHNNNKIIKYLLAKLSPRSENSRTSGSVFSSPCVTDKILFYGIIMEALFALLALIEFPLRMIFQDYSISPRNGIILGYLAAIFIGLFIIYFLSYKNLKKNPVLLQNKFKIIVFFFILFQLTLLFIPPIGSADVYNYVFRTKVLTHYHENPYLVPAGNFPDDNLAMHAQQGGGGNPLIYGPFWLLISILPTILSGGTVFWGSLSFKAVAILFNAGTLYLIFKILEKIKPEKKYLGAFLYALNPFLLFEIANNGHNDIAMVFFVILSIYLFIQEKYYLGLSFLTLSVLVKFISLILVPIYALMIMNKKIGFFKKSSAVLISILIFFTIVYSSYMLAGGNIKIISGVSKQASLYAVTYMSPLPFLIELTTNISQKSIKQLGALFFIIIYFFLTLKIFALKKNSPINLIKYSFFAFFLYILVGNTSLLPWYFLWLMPLIILLSYTNIVLILTFMLPIGYIIFPSTSYILSIFMICVGYILNKYSPAIEK